MVAALVLVVGLGVFQLGLALYVRNTLIAAASEGARYGARADAGPDDAVARTRSLLGTSFGSSESEVAAVRSTTSTGVRVMEVTVSAPLPVVGPLGPSGGLTVTGRAFSEEQVLSGASP